MNEKKPEITYTDGESVTAVQFEIEKSGEAGVLNALGALATSMNTGDFFDALMYTPEYRATRDAFNATPWIHFKQRRELSKRMKVMQQDGRHYRRPDDDTLADIEILEVDTSSQED